MYNDIVTSIGRGNGAMLDLLDISAAFHTIDHDNIFFHTRKYVGICGNALKLISHVCLMLLILFVVFLKAQF